METIIDMQREFNVNLGKAIYDSIENLQYFINIQESISETWIEKKYPKHERDKECYREASIEDYPMFKNVISLERVVEDFNKLNSTKYRSVFLTFARSNYEFIKLATSFELKDLAYLEMILLTEVGIKNRYKSINVDEYTEYTKDEMELKKKEQLDSFSYWTLEAIEILYVCLRYCDEMNSLLHINSDKIGRTLRMFTGKE